VLESSLQMRRLSSAPVPSLFVGIRLVGLYAKRGNLVLRLRASDSGSPMKLTEIANRLREVAAETFGSARKDSQGDASKLP